MRRIQHPAVAGGLGSSQHGGGSIFLLYFFRRPRPGHSRSRLHTVGIAARAEHKLTPDGANAARTTKGQERHVSLTQLYGRGRYYALGLVQTEPASIRSVSRRKVLAMASSVSSSQ